MGKILVTGATGNVGCEVVKALVNLGQSPVSAVLDEQDAQRAHAGVPTAFLRFGDESTYAGAFEGVHKLFLMRPPQISDVKTYLFPVIAYAITAGVKHIVFLSLIGIEDNKQVPHYKVEQYLEKCGVPYTFIRPSFYMQNLNTTHRAEIRDRNEIAIPAGHARTNFIDVRDIGEVTAKVLSEPGHENRAYELTGGQALDYYEVADILSEVLGRKITYTNPGLLRFVISTVRGGTRLPFALIMAFLYTQTRRGMANRKTGTVELLLGKAPRTFQQYAEAYAAIWQSNVNSKDTWVGGMK